MRWIIILTLVALTLSGCSSANSELVEDTKKVLEVINESMETGTYEETNYNRTSMYLEEWGDLEALPKVEQEIVGTIMLLDNIAMQYPDEKDPKKRAQYRQDFIEHKEKLLSLIK